MVVGSGTEVEWVVVVCRAVFECKEGVDVLDEGMVVPTRLVFRGQRGGESKVGVGMGVIVELVGLVLMAVEWEEAEEEIAWWV